MYPSPVVQVQGQQGMAPKAQIVEAPESQLEMSVAMKGRFAGLGAAQLIIGCLSMTFNCSTMGSSSTLTSIIAPGFWCGVFFILAGAFGIAVGILKDKVWVVTFLVLSIISAIASVVVFSVASVSIVINQDPSARCHDRDVSLVTLGVAELVIAILSSAICCGALYGRQQSTSIHYGNPITGQTYPAGGAVPQVAYPTQGHQETASQEPPPPYGSSDKILLISTE